METKINIDEFIGGLIDALEQIRAMNKQIDFEHAIYLLKRLLEKQSLKVENKEIIEIQKPKEYSEVVNECIFGDEFKPGDILVASLLDGSKSIFIFREEKDGLISAYSSCSSGFFYTDTEFLRKGIRVRKAEPEERDLLFRMIEENNLKWIPEELRFEGTIVEAGVDSEEPNIDRLVQEYRNSLPFTGDYGSYSDALAEAFRQGLVIGLNMG